MATSSPELPVKETLFRGNRAPVEIEAVSVDRLGGKNRAGVIYGVSLISKGEALGHDAWIDGTTLDQVVELANRGNSGLKSRFTHPGMSADGLGRHLGRIHNVYRDGDRVVGDLHFSESAHKTPEGDLANYVMDLAEEDPAAAGLSIVFEHDPDAERAFMEESGPDDENEKGYRHVRLAKLRAADVVDEPAANPSGLFDRQSLPRDVDALLSYAAGLSEAKPECIAFGVDADRASQFLSRWLSSHGLSITQKGEDMPKETEPANPVQSSYTREDFAAELKRYTDRFGAENGNQWFTDGLSFSDALEKHCETLIARIAELETELASANEKIAAVSLGEATPLDVGVSDSGKPNERKTLASRIRVVGGPSAN